MRVVLSSIATAGLALGWLLATPAASNAQQGAKRVPRVTVLGDWRVHHPDHPQKEAWTPEDVARFLERFPETVFVVGNRDAIPIGNRYTMEEAARIRELRGELQRRGIDFDQRVCLAFRPDVARIFEMGNGSCDPSRGGAGCDVEGGMDGSLGEKEVVVKAAGVATGGTETSLVDERATWHPGRWIHRLLVLRPGLPNEERRRIVASDAHTVRVDRAWSEAPKPADRYEIRGSFDPRWVQLVPREKHQWALERLWEGARNVCVGPGGRCKPPAEPLDPLHPRNLRAWPNPLDKQAIVALATPTHVPALYGFVREGAKRGVLDDPYFEVSAVVTRLEDPDYREWMIHYVLYKLRDHGFAPGNGPCLLLGYKPGWHAYYDEEKNGPSTHRCTVKGSNMWTGPTHYCKIRDDSPRISPGGRFAPTPYGPGEFEAAINAFILELLGTLKARGYQKPRIITSERPTFGPTFWSVLSEEVRNHPAIIGEQKGPIDPPLSLIRSRSEAVSEPTPPPVAPPSAPAAPAPAVDEASDPPADDGLASAPKGHDWSIGSPRSGRPSAQPGPSRTPRRSDLVRSSGGGGESRTFEPPSRRR